ncbi:hypothetical protein A3197_01505 [Candidatus Thiodiazotropha endoloripes]|nr:hypothetical protein A3197_01505 [Candidatus Thiodiazotropha endoloripes]
MTQHSDEWLAPTREKLDRWGEYLRAIKSDKLGYSSRASHLSTPGEGSAMPDDEVAEMMDRLMCKVQEINFEAYRVLSMYYWTKHSDGSIGKALQKPRLKCREIRISGEAMVAAMIHEEKKLKINT